MMKLKPSEVLFVGDSIRLDIKGAKKVGMKTCLTLYSNSKVKNSGADWEIRRIGELMGIV